MQGKPECKFAKDLPDGSEPVSSILPWLWDYAIASYRTGVNFVCGRYFITSVSLNGSLLPLSSKTFTHKQWVRGPIKGGIAVGFGLERS